MSIIHKIHSAPKPAPLSKCKCGGEPERMPFYAMSYAYEIKCAKCGKSISELDAHETDLAWEEENK